MKYLQTPFALSFRSSSSAIKKRRALSTSFCASSVFSYSLKISRRSASLFGSMKHPFLRSFDMIPFRRSSLTVRVSASTMPLFTGCFLKYLSEPASANALKTLSITACEPKDDNARRPSTVKRSSTSSCARDVAILTLKLIQDVPVLARFCRICCPVARSATIRVFSMRGC